MSKTTEATADLTAIYRAGNNLVTDAYQVGVHDGKAMGRDEQAREHHQWLLSHDDQLAQVAQEARREALLDAADAWEQASVDGLRKLAEERYTAGGPSMPTIWLRLRAEAASAEATP